MRSKPVDIYQVRRFVWKVRDRVEFTSPEKVGEYVQQHIFTPFAQFEQEEMWVFLLNVRSLLTHQVMLGRGTVDSIQLRASELFREAVRFNARSLVLAHNHPSGDPEPSREDLSFTEAIVKAGQLLNCQVVDHLIVGKDDWVSFREKGLVL